MPQGHPFRVNGTEFARRRFLHLTAGAAALPAISRGARAQTYPSRPITMIVPFAAGGLTDVVGRVVAERMVKSLGQPIIIENVAGADGSIGVGRAARARPDGYTIDLGVLPGDDILGWFDVIGTCPKISIGNQARGPTDSRCSRPGS